MNKNRYEFSRLILALSFSLPTMGCGGGGGESQGADPLEIRQEIDNVHLEGAGPDSFTTFETTHYTEWNWEGWEVDAFDHLQNIHFSPAQTPFYLTVEEILYDGTTVPIIAPHYFQECSQETHSHQVTFQTIPTNMEIGFHVGDDQATLTYTQTTPMNARVLFTLTFDCRGMESPQQVVSPSVGGGNIQIMK